MTTPFKDNRTDRMSKKQFLEHLRLYSTPAEKKLYGELLLAFRPYKAIVKAQCPIGAYIADFFIFGCNVVVEVDGGYHARKSQRQYDQSRDSYMRNQGMRVFRFTNERVESGARQIALAILKECQPIDLMGDMVKVTKCPPRAANGHYTTWKPRTFWHGR